MVLRRVAVLSILLLALGTLPAHAGGPTSVVLSAPPSVMAVGYEDPQYNELQQLTEIGAGASKVDTKSHEGGRFVRATWLIHDMSVWRIDIIYPDAPGGPWIATTESLTTGTMPERPTWHTPTNSAALVKLLGSLKLLNSNTFIGGPTLDYQSTAPDQVTAPDPTTEPAQPTAGPAQPATAQVQTDPGFFTGWRWTIPGFLIGAAVTVVAVRLLPKRRWELLD